MALTSSSPSYSPLRGNGRRRERGSASILPGWFRQTTKSLFSTGPRQYRPAVLSTPVFVLLLFVIVILFSLTEYACRTLPNHNAPTIATAVPTKAVKARRAASVVDAVPATVEAVPRPRLEPRLYSNFSVPEADDYLPSSITTLSPEPTSTSSTSQPSEVEAYSADASSFISPNVVTPSGPASDGVTSEPATGPSIEITPTAGPESQSEDAPITPSLTVAPSEYINPTVENPESREPPSAAPSESYISPTVESKDPASQSEDASITLTKTDATSRYINPSVETPAPQQTSTPPPDSYINPTVESSDPATPAPTATESAEVSAYIVPGVYTYDPNAPKTLPGDKMISADEGDYIDPAVQSATPTPDPDVGTQEPSETPTVEESAAGAAQPTQKYSADVSDYLPPSIQTPRPPRPPGPKGKDPKAHAGESDYIDSTVATNIGIISEPTRFISAPATDYITPTAGPQTPSGADTAVTSSAPPESYIPSDVHADNPQDAEIESTEYMNPNPITPRPSADETSYLSPSPTEYIQPTPDLEEYPDAETNQYITPTPATLTTDNYVNPVVQSPTPAGNPSGNPSVEPPPPPPPPPPTDGDGDSSQGFETDQRGPRFSVDPGNYIPPRVSTQVVASYMPSEVSTPVGGGGTSPTDSPDSREGAEPTPGFVPAPDNYMSSDIAGPAGGSGTSPTGAAQPADNKGSAPGRGSGSNGPQGGDSSDDGAGKILDAAYGVATRIVEPIANVFRDSEGGSNQPEKGQNRAQRGPDGVATTFIAPTPVVTSVDGSLRTLASAGAPVTMYIPGAQVVSSAEGSVVTTSVGGSLVTTSVPGHLTTKMVDGSQVVSSVEGSVVTTSVPGSEVVTSLPGSKFTTYVPGHYVTTMASGSLVVSSVSGYLLTASIPPQMVVSSVSGSLLTTFMSGMMITTSVPGSVITTSLPGSEVVTTLPGSLVTTMISGTLVTTSMPGAVITTSVPGSEVVTTLPGSLVTTSISGVLITTSVPERVITTSLPGSQVVTTLPGSLITTMISGTLVTTSVPETVITTSLPGSEVVTTIPGSLLTTSVSGTLVTTSVPGYLTTKTQSGSLVTSSVSGFFVTMTPRPGAGSRGGEPGASSTAGGSAAAETGGPYGSGANRLDRPLVNLTESRYFVGSYLPMVSAILLRITVGMVYAAIKMMEPFYTLNDAAGAGAKDCLSVFYLSTNHSLDPFIAMFRGHWLILFVSVLYLGVGLLTPLSSEFLTFHTFENIHRVRGPEMRVNVVVGRFLEGLLAFAAVMLIGLWLLQRRHRSGVYSDPSSIATIISLLHHPAVLEDFQQIPADATRREMEEILADKRYCLASYRCPDGRERYGLVPAQGSAPSRFAFRQSAYTRVQGDDDAGVGRNEKRRPRRPRQPGRYIQLARITRDAIFVVVCCGVLVIAQIYYWKPDREIGGFGKFMSSDGFGPRFLMTLAGMLMHSEWKRVERELCVHEPFRALARGNAPAKSSILVERTLSPFTTFFAALWRRHFFVALAAFMAILAEVLIVSLAGIPFNSGQLHRAFIVTSWISFSIMVLMLISLLIINLRPGALNLPRQPDTIASLSSYLCYSSLLHDFADFAKMDGRSRNEEVMFMRRTYCLTKTKVEPDGAIRWQIDYDSVDTP